MLWDVDLWREMERLRREMNGLFENAGRASGSTTYPLVNVYDDSENIVVTAELPGMSKEKVNISFADGTLSIAGKLEPMLNVKNMSVVRQERTVGEFEKIVRIPTKVQADKINAAFSNGILTIRMPKAEEVKPKTITIEAR
jgi:HSP20 family protein